MKPTHNRVYCIGCKRPKMLFESQAKADNFIKYNRDEIASLYNKVLSRSYYCSFCCGWHVTSVDEEGRAKANDKRDEHTWQRIIAQGRKKLPLTEKGKKLAEMLVITQSLIQKCQRQLLLTNLGSALEMMKELVLEFSIIEDIARRQMIDSSRIDKQRMKIKALQTVFNIIDEYDIDNETCQSYLNNGITASNEFARNYFLNKAYIDNIKALFNELDNVRNTIGLEEYKRRCDNIAIAINSYNGKGLSTVKTEFHNRLVKHRNNPPEQSIQKALKSNYRSTYLSVIETLEHAHKAITESDFERCNNLIKTAECLMPDSSDEISQILWLQIQMLREKLP